ncbi:MAG: hypothetical protein ABL894_06560 [Hyphomicrobium sp.]
MSRFNRFLIEFGACYGGSRGLNSSAGSAARTMIGINAGGVTLADI